MCRTAKLVVIAHHVSIPLRKHRSKEFSDRVFFLAKHFDEVHLISEETNVDVNDRLCVKDDFASNITTHRVRSGFIASNVAVSRIVESVAADGIFADGIAHGASSFLSKKKYGIPLITFVQGYEADLKAIELKLKFGIEPTPGMLSRLFALYDSIILRTSDRVLCVGPGLVEYARGLLAKKDWDKVELIPHSLQYVRYIPKEAMMWAEDIVASFKKKNEQLSSLLMVIGVGPSKGTDIAVKAHKYIVEKNPDAAMVLVSKGLDPKYVKMANELGLKDNILFLQNLPRNHVLALLSHASALLCPSFSEGFSWAVAEAMALGVPVVAYMNKSLRDAVNKGAVVAVRTTNPEDYARKCISLIRDEKFRGELVQKAKDYIRPFVLFPEKKRFELISNNIDQVLSIKRARENRSYFWRTSAKKHLMILSSSIER